MKFSKSFKRDFTFYSENMNNFIFSGKPIHVNSKESYSNTVMEAFHIWDSTGRTVDCTHPYWLKRLIQSKASCNWHIKQFAIDRAKGNLSRNELIEICKEINAPEWFMKAVENQKVNYL